MTDLAHPALSTVSFGIKTVPVGATYRDILAVWQEADAIPEIEHAWLWDHYLPLFGDPATPIHEGWTMLAALAGQTRRLGLGLMVASNRTHPPAVLAKIAATVDQISQGRLVFGIGVGATDQLPSDHQQLAVREYRAYGLPLVAPAEGVASLAEALTIIKRMWTEDRFDFEGRHYRLQGAICEPKPVRRPHPPVMVGGWGRRTLQVVAEHADIWNVPGPPHNTVAYIRERSRILDEHLAAAGRDPREVTRSTQVIVTDGGGRGGPWLGPAQARATIQELVGAGVTHIVLNLVAPFRAGAARWAAEEIIMPVRERTPAA